MTRSKLITVYRKSSPRTARDYDSKLIEKRQLNFYLKRGYFKELPLPDEDLDDIEACAELMDEAEVPEDDRYLFYQDPEPEPEENSKLKFEDFTDLEKENIQNDKRSMAKLAEVHNTTYYVIRKIKGKLWVGQKDN